MISKTDPKRSGRYALALIAVVIATVSTGCTQSTPTSTARTQTAAATTSTDLPEVVISHVQVAPRS